MDSPADHTITARQYRYARIILTLGTMAAGLLLVNRLVGHFLDSFNEFYGVTDTSARMAPVDGQLLSWTIGQWFIIIASTVGIGFFIGAEALRARRIAGHRARASKTGRLQIIAALSRKQLLEAFVLRSSLFASVMLLGWIVEASYARYFAGLGWGLGNGDFVSLLPLVSVFGLCVLVGLFVAAASLFGLRVLATLEALTAPIRVLRRIVRSISCNFTSAVRNIRDRFGLEILSRPPPVVRV